MIKSKDDVPSAMQRSSKALHTLPGEAMTSVKLQISSIFLKDHQRPYPESVSRAQKNLTTMQAYNIGTVQRVTDTQVNA